MTRAPLLSLLLLVAAGCPGPNPLPDAGAHLNPPELWLAPNGSELQVRLSPVKPIPY